MIDDNYLHKEKKSALVKLIEYIDKIKQDNKSNISIINELNNDTKVILKEISKITRDK